MALCAQQHGPLWTKGWKGHSGGRPAHIRPTQLASLSSMDQTAKNAVTSDTGKLDEHFALFETAMEESCAWDAAHEDEAGRQTAPRQSTFCLPQTKELTPAGALFHNDAQDSRMIWNSLDFSLGHKQERLLQGPAISSCGGGGHASVHMW